MGCFGPSPEPLWVILPYFNFCKFQKRRDLFIKFVNEIKAVPGIKIVVAEVIGPAPLPKLPVGHHYTFETDSTIWLKENLVNMGIRRLPPDWKYVAWIDADISFLNRNWVQDTIRELRSYDVVQMWQTCVNLGPTDEAIKIDKSFGFMHQGSGTAYTPTDRYGHWHPGYAWACTQKAWKQMDGLIDWAILGSGDRHMAMGLIASVLVSAPGNINKNYKTLLETFERNSRGLEVSYVNGTILHHWHGRFKDRRYRERWSILTENNFDPFDDIGATKDGFIQFTKKGRRLEKALQEYFIERREDSVEI